MDIMLQHGEYRTRIADEQHSMSIVCKSVRRLPQHALATCCCSSCSLQSHLDWLYSSDVRAQPSTAKVTGMHRASGATISDSTLLSSLLQKLYDCMAQWLEW